MSRHNHQSWRSLHLNNVNVVNNTSSGDLGGGICYLKVFVTEDDAGQDSPHLIVNSIIWGNLPEQIDAYISEGLSNPDTLIIAYSDIQDGIEVGLEDIMPLFLEGNFDVDPLFTDPENGDFTLQEGSPCIDAGTAYLEWWEEVIVDLNSEDYYGAAPDMGAFESDFGCSNLGDVNGDGGWNILDIVTLVNCILSDNCADLENGCAGDINDDGGWNILDVVTLVSCVLADNCN